VHGYPKLSNHDDDKAGRVDFLVLELLAHGCPKRALPRSVRNKVRKQTLPPVRFLRPAISAVVRETISSALSRRIRRLRCLGLIKRVAKTYRYYLTRAGRAVIAAASHITEYGIVPALA
jgi:DNA-binding HxlR family transcriptional regulator